jgi:hypothetical protein
LERPPSGDVLLGGAFSGGWRGSLNVMYFSCLRLLLAGRRRRRGRSLGRALGSFRFKGSRTVLYSKPCRMTGRDGSLECDIGL